MLLHAILIGVLLLAGAVLHMLAWSELRGYNWFDIIMREGPPFEDLTGRGQVLMICSWPCGAAAMVLLVMHYVWPRAAAFL